MLVFVSGATGFIAQHIIKNLLEKKYQVVGTARSAEKGEKLVNRISDAGLSGFTYEIVPNISEPGAFDKVFQKHSDIDIVLHTASPFFYDVQDAEKELIIPTINGTKSVLDAVQRLVEKGSHIKRVVITSSDAAIYSPDDEQNKALSFDETSWNNISYEEAKKDAINAYYGAKTFAEKAAWEYAGKDNFPPVTCVNPVYVFGPQAFDADAKGKLNTSNEMVRELLGLGESGTFENSKGGFVDVRDVAKAHLAAFEQEETVDKRLYLTNGKFSVQMMVDVIREKFPELQGSVPRGTPGTGNKDIETLAATSNTATRKLLTWDFVPLEKCLVDIVRQIRG